MANPTMPATEGLNVYAVQLAHALRECRAWGFDEQMIAIVHRTVGLIQPAIPVDRLGEGGEKPRTIFVIAHDPLVGVSASSQMMDGVGKLQTSG